MPFVRTCISFKGDEFKGRVKRVVGTRFSILRIYRNRICSNRIYLIDILIYFFSFFFIAFHNCGETFETWYIRYIFQKCVFRNSRLPIIYDSHNSCGGMIVPVNHRKIIVLRKFLFFFDYAASIINNNKSFIHFRNVDCSKSWGKRFIKNYYSPTFFPLVFNQPTSREFLLRFNNRH